LCGELCAQYNIRGEIYDAESDEALIGANVIIRGTSTGTTTEWDGSFLIRVDSLPVSLEVTYTGFDSQIIEVTDHRDKVIIRLTPVSLLIETVEITGSRVSDRRKEAPLTVESLDLIAIRETASNDFYEGLGTLKGVDLTTASLGFTIINTRGFNSTSPVRSLQIIDGVDNQAPGLNFSLGNFLGAPELDVLKVDLIQGASSAFYGPNAFNGVIDIRTKDPFVHKGLSASVKVGERNLVLGMIRWAQAFQNKMGEDKFAYKFNLSFLRADDWEARNFDPSFQSKVDQSNPGGYDAVNIYGDENVDPSRESTQLFDRIDFPGLLIFHRQGYAEVDLVDYNTENIKGNVGLFYNFTRDWQLNGGLNFGSGTTVYQGENRFRLDDIFFWQGKVELRHSDKF
ncbi:MAG: carboxypeptidase-like regulatory domain-containing protein, partial [Saprospiraceae bacterium]|nr:carboxypeptidase-like regulatory domain-containing protein [Saprospiraceae bacterium]